MSEQTPFYHEGEKSWNYVSCFTYFVVVSK